MSPHMLASDDHSAVVTLLLLAAVAIPVVRPPSALPTLTAATDWQPFDEAAIARHVKQGSAQPGAER